MYAKISLMKRYITQTFLKLLSLWVPTKTTSSSLYLFHNSRLFSFPFQTLSEAYPAWTSEKSSYTYILGRWLRYDLYIYRVLIVVYILICVPLKMSTAHICVHYFYFSVSMSPLGNPNLKSSPVSLDCRKRRINQAALQIRLKKQRPRITAGVTQSRSIRA